MKRSNQTVFIAVLLAAVILPYVVAALAAGEAFDYIGFLINPFDSASYLAKMRQGWEGSWRFVLPFTAQPGEGAYLFTFYLFLGHLARITGLSMVLVFHIARGIGSLLLLLALARFVHRVFRDQADLAMVAFALAAVGSGMGWLLMFSGYLTSDTWVAEAYPFLSMFSNPHFPIGLAILLWYFAPLMGAGERPRPALLLLLAGLAVSVIMPFGVVVGLLIAGSTVLWKWLEARRQTRTAALDWQHVFWFGLVGGLFLLYQFWAAQTDPILAGWNAQNLTITRPLWDVVLSLSPALPLALIGVVYLWREKSHPARHLLIAWLVLGLALIYVPFSLQRRFMLGLYVPTAVLALLGVQVLRARFKRPLRGLIPTLLSLSFLTNVLWVLILMMGALTHPPELYLATNEVQAFAWIRSNTAPDALVLASPEIGLLIPGLTGRRVIYGHPYETVNAVEEQAAVESFFREPVVVTRDDPRLEERGVSYIFYSPREAELALGGGPDFTALPVVFQAGSVTIYEVVP